MNPEARKDEKPFITEWKGAQGLAEDVRHYGKWMRDEAEKRIGHLYPKVTITPEMVEERPDLKQYEGKDLTVIAWLWARTVKSPNPAFADVRFPGIHLHAFHKERQRSLGGPVIDDGGLSVYREGWEAEGFGKGEEWNFCREKERVPLYYVWCTHFL
ncbi:hypothetical protein MASR2M79_04290 [Aminivibrio sp.]